MRRGMSQAEFAKFLGVSTAAVGNWESEANGPNRRRLIEIADKLGVSPDYLIGEDFNASERSSPPVVLRDSTPVKYSYRDHSGPYWGATNRAPIISWASAGAAHAFEDQGEMETVPTNCRDANCYALFVEGDSMEPEYHKGDVLIIAPNAEPKNGDLVVARLLDGSAYFKKYTRIGAPGRETIRLSSFNERFYPPIDVPINEVEKIHPIHSVVRVFRPDA